MRLSSEWMSFRSSAGSLVDDVRRLRKPFSDCASVGKVHLSRTLAAHLGRIRRATQRVFFPLLTSVRCLSLNLSSVSALVCSHTVLTRFSSAASIAVSSSRMSVPLRSNLVATVAQPRPDSPAHSCASFSNWRWAVSVVTATHSTQTHRLILDGLEKLG